MLGQGSTGESVNHVAHHRSVEVNLQNGDTGVRDGYGVRHPPMTYADGRYGVADDNSDWSAVGHEYSWTRILVGTGERAGCMNTGPGASWKGHVDHPH